MDTATTFACANPTCAPLVGESARNTERVPGDVASVCEGARNGDACELQCAFGHRAAGTSSGAAKRWCGADGECMGGAPAPLYNSNPNRKRHLTLYIIPPNSDLTIIRLVR